MEDIIREMVETDNEAKRIVAPASARQNALADEIEAAREAIRTEITADYESKLSALRKEATEKEAAVNDAVRRAAKMSLSRMEETYLAKKEEWKESLVHTIIG